MGQWNKYIQVKCKNCNLAWKKRDDTLKAWSGLCRCCIQKQVKNLPESIERQKILSRNQVLRQGGIPNAKKFTSVPKELHPRWKGGKPKCIDCQIELSTYNVFRCKSCAHKGQLHWNWLNGKSFEPYPAQFNKNLKNRIRKRDNFICKGCGITEPELNEKLTIHHINYIKEDCSDNNLISVCRSCNSKANYGRENWIKFYKLQLESNTQIKKTA